MVEVEAATNERHSFRRLFWCALLLLCWFPLLLLYTLNFLVQSISLNFCSTDMGRRTSWNPHDIDVVRGRMAEGKTTTGMATLRSDWSQSTIKKLVALLNAAGGDTGAVNSRKRSFTAASPSSVKSTSRWVGHPLSLVKEGGFFYTEMTGSDKTDRTQRASMFDKTRAHLDTVSEGPNQARSHRKEGFNNSSEQDPCVFPQKKSGVSPIRETKHFHLLGPCQPESLA